MQRHIGLTPWFMCGHMQFLMARAWKAGVVGAKARQAPGAGRMGSCVLYYEEGDFI